MVVLDNKTGGVPRWSAGIDYQDAAVQHRHRGRRQPGSSFKPFTLVTALEQGHSPDEVFTSAPQQLPFRAKVPKQERQGDKIIHDVFRVNNYDDEYLGSASITTATTYSDNSVYAQLGHAGRPAERRRDRAEDGHHERPLAPRKQVLRQRRARSSPTTPR